MDRPSGSSAVVVQPLASRIHIQDAPGQLTIQLGRRSRWYQRLLAAFSVLWCGLGLLIIVTVAGGIVFDTYIAANRAAQPDVVRTVICLPAMLLFPLGLSFLILRVAWRRFTSLLMRREVISISAAEWLIERDFGLWRGRRRLQSANISNLQLVLRNPGASIRAAMHLYTDEPGSISLQHKRSRVAVGTAATEAEARQIISAILRRFPGLAGPDTTPSPKLGNSSARPPWSIDQKVAALVVTLAVEHSWRSRLILIWYLLFGVAWTVGFVILLVKSLGVVGAPLSFIGLLVIGAGMGLFASFWSLRDLRWRFLGQEVVTVTARDIRIEGVNLWLGRPRVFLGEYIRGLRYAPQVYRSEERLAWLRQPARWGTLAFDYGAGTYRFGNNLGFADAAELLQLILKQFPQYGPDQ